MKMKDKDHSPSLAHPRKVRTSPLLLINRRWKLDAIGRYWPLPRRLNWLWRRLAGR